MSEFWLGVLMGILAVGVAPVFALRMAYRNGVIDGYGYSREPNCPGYAFAGEYLRKTMAHRWMELQHEPQQEPTSNRKRRRNMWD